MKYDLVIAYRIYPKMSKNPVDDFGHDKYVFAEKCLTSLKTALGELTCKVYAILDNNCPPEYEKLFTNRFKKDDLEIIHTNLGNKGTFKKQIEILSTQNDSNIIYFAEDDYFYVKNLENMIHFIKSKKADFVSPYEHPACYTDGHIIKNERVLFEDQEYISVQHACLTFMTTKENLIKNKRYMLIYSDWFGSDFVVWGTISLGRTYFKYFRLLLHPKNYTIINLKVYGSMLFFAWQRFVMNKKYKLFMPVMSFGTHMEKDWLAPGVNWSDYFNRA